jgi:type IV pilus assembly protein PilX
MPGVEYGATLVATLLILIVVLLLSVAATQIALQGEKTARNDRDRQIALQAAEAALLDAETDIEASPDNVRSRSELFSRYSALGFPADAGACGNGMQNRYLGLCQPAALDKPAIWRTLDFADAGIDTTRSVPYGQFTGNVFPSGGGSLPVRPPRYVIELIPDKSPGERADRNAYLYRITAVGFGVSQHTQAAVQTIYRKTR